MEGGAAPSASAQDVDAARRWLLRRAGGKEPDVDEKERPPPEEGAAAYPGGSTMLAPLFLSFSSPELEVAFEAHQEALQARWDSTVIRVFLGAGRRRSPRAQRAWVGGGHP
jgi:hypothetical protein